MKITIKPPAQHGFPVFIEGRRVIPPAEALPRVLETLKIDRDTLAELTGKTRRTVDGWFSGRTVPPEAMNVIGTLLEKRP